MVAVADTKKQRSSACYSKGHDKEKVKSSAPAANPTGDPEAPITFLQFQILSSKMGQVLKAAEKLIELQSDAFRANPPRRRMLSLISPTSKAAISSRDQTKHLGSVRTQSFSSPERLHPPRPRRTSNLL